MKRMPDLLLMWQIYSKNVSDHHGLAPREKSGTLNTPCKRQEDQNNTENLTLKFLEFSTILSVSSSDELKKHLLSSLAI